ncbi:hypothetical protein NL676_010895, partial [Syzygium grande]
VLYPLNQDGHGDGGASSSLSGLLCLMGLTELDYADLSAVFVNLGYNLSS